MSSIVDRLIRTIRRERLLGPGDRVAVAVSGGSDSVALAHLMRDVAPALECRFVGLCHLNHRLRGADADEDERFCRDLAVRLGVPIEVGAADVRERARESRTSIEVAARHARYAFYSDAAGRLGANRVVVGHTRNDQAETYFLRLLRGAGPGGLAGIRPRAGLVIRPALDLTRQELRTFLEAMGAGFRDDASNLDPGIPRNRIRHELIPYLQRHFAPAIVDVAARNAVIARVDSEWLDEAAAEAADSMVREDGGRIAIDRMALVALPKALAMRVARSALERIGAGGVGLEGVARVLDMASGHPAEADFPGCHARVEGGTLRLAARRGRGASAPAGRLVFDYPLPVPGQVSVPEASLVIEVETAGKGGPDLERPSGRGTWLAVDAGRVTLPLEVRNWRSGDRFRPLGFHGHKTLQDFFVDRKVPRADRARVPLVVDREGRIVWIVGHAPAEDFRVTAGSPAVLILKVRQVGGAG